MGERIDVMISSTAQDLPNYRQQAMDACVRQGMFPIMMEHLPAMAEDAIQASLRMVDEAEVYVGIFAERYGYIPAGYEISITEMEYNHAKKRGIPCLIFIAANPDEFPQEDDEIKNAKLVVFKDRLKTDQVVNFFTTPADFRGQLINSLSRIKLRRTSTLDRTNLIPILPNPYIAHPYTLLETNHLFGRSVELQWLSDWLAGESPTLQAIRVLNVVAIGGMGKSSLTWKWFNELAPHAKELAGSLWWSFYEADAHYENFITRALAYTSEQPEEILRKKTLPQREADLLSLLHQKPFLLVLDGLERMLIAYNRTDAARQLDQEDEFPQLSNRSGQNRLTDVLGLTKTKQGSGIHSRLRKTTDPRAGNFFRKLATVQASRILVSTRLYPADLETSAGTEIAGSAALWLEGLADPDALQLWQSLGVNGSENALVELFHSFANYPLLIRALAGEVARYRRAPRDFDAWRKANPNFNPFDLPMVQRQSHILQFALTGLEESPIHVLRTVAAFNAPTSYGTLADLLVTTEEPNTGMGGGGNFTPFQSEQELDTALTELEERGLIGWDRDANRYDLHPVIRGVVWNTLNEGDQQGIYEQIRSYLEAVPKVDNWRKIRRREELSATLELYQALISLRRFDQAADILANRLYRPLRYTFSDGQTLTSLLEMLFPKNSDLPQLTQPHLQAWTLNALAQAYQMTGQPKRAVPLFERSNLLKEAVSYTVDLSTGLRDLAYAQRLIGNLRNSEAAARHALSLDRQDSNGMLESLSLQVLGLALAARGEASMSGKALDYSLDLADRHNANRAYNHHAMRALWFGDHSAALDWADKAKDYCKKKRLEAQLILATRLHGEAALGLKMLEVAEEGLHEALTHARSVKLMEEEMAALIALADLRRQQGLYPLAIELLEDVWDTCEHAPYRLFHADACNVLAYIERERGDTGAAVGAAMRAYELSWCDGVPYAYHRGLMTAKTHLGVLGIPEPALATYNDDEFPPMLEIEMEVT